MFQEVLLVNTRTPLPLGPLIPPKPDLATLTPGMKRVGGKATKKNPHPTPTKIEDRP